MPRKALIALAGLLVVLALVLWLDHASNASGEPPPRSAAQLATLDDRELERQVLSDLAQRVLGPAGSPTAWQSFTIPARSVWALGISEQWLATYGLKQMREIAVERPEVPGLADARDACAAMELPAAAQGFSDALTGSAADLPAIQARLTASLALLATRAKRTTYIRQHLEELAVPR